MFKLARDLQMYAFTTGITGECCGEYGGGGCSYFFLHVYFKSTCVNNYQLISSFWGLFDLVIFSPLFFLLCQTLEHSFTLISSTWPCSCHLCVSFHHKKSITAISCVAARTPCEHFSYMCSRVSFSAGPRVLGDFNVADEWGSQISSVFEKTIRLDS